MLVKKRCFIIFLVLIHTAITAGYGTFRGTHEIPSNPDLCLNQPQGADDHLVLFLHGFGDRNRPEMHASLQHYLPHNYLVTGFNFFDKRVCFYNFGQNYDAYYVLKALTMAIAAGYKNISLLGHSRGAAAALEALYLLTYPESYKKELAAGEVLTKNGSVDHELVTKIRNALKGIYLLRPLLSLSFTIDHLCQKEFLSSCAQRAVCWFTAWDRKQKSPLEKLATMVRERSLLCHLEIQFSQADSVVGSKGKKLVYQLQKESPKNLRILPEVSHDHNDIWPDILEFSLFTGALAKQAQ